MFGHIIEHLLKKLLKMCFTIVKPIACSLKTELSLANSFVDQNFINAEYFFVLVFKIALWDKSLTYFKTKK